MQIVERTGERQFAAELNRHKGEFLLRQGHTEAAEELYRKALSIAEEQQAKLWELRAAASLARLHRDQGRRAEARDLLAPVYGWLALNRLDRRDRTTLIAKIAGGEALPDEIVDQIVERTDGVPLFVEELTKSVLESGVPLVGIPTTLHDSLTARLDRLGSVRRVAQIGAAIGREFSYVAAACCLPSRGRKSAKRLSIASSPLSWCFSEARRPTRSTASDTRWSRTRLTAACCAISRQQLHAQIAEALETHYPEMIENQPELFAQHYAEAGLVEKSIAYWGKAGHRSATRSAMAEASAQFQKGLDQLALLPDTPERQRQELEFSSALGSVLRAIKGYAAPETGQVYARARELWEHLGSPSEFLHIPFGQSVYHMGRGELDLVQRLDEDLLRLSRQRNDFRRARSGPLVFRSRPDACRPLCSIPIASGRRDCAL